MSDKKRGPFDAAIECMNEMAFKLGEKYGQEKVNREQILQEMEELVAAHKVLETVAKLNKKIAITALQGTDSETDVWKGRWNEFCEISSLLESLPDEEGK